MQKKSQNYLLAKTGLGQVRKGFHHLPPSNHIYGKQPTKDKYGVRQVLWNWLQSQKSSSKLGGKDYISMNRQGIKQGFIDSKQLSYFHKNNEIKMKIKQGQKLYGLKIPDEEFTYGIPNRPSTPMKNVICNTYALDDQNLRNERQAVEKLLQHQKKPKSTQKTEPSPKTKHQQQINRKRKIEQNNFKLSKFKNIPSKIKPLIQANKNKIQSLNNLNKKQNLNHNQGNYHHVHPT